MFSRFFIDRPIFAAVLSIFIILAGLASMRVLPIAQYPEISPPVVTVTRDLPGGVGAGARIDRRRAARERDQRRRGHAVHELDLVGERHGADPGDLQHRHRHRQGDAQRQQPREAGRAEAAGRGAPPGHHGREGLVGLPPSARLLLARGALRRHLHLELRHAQRARRDQARAGHDAGADLRRQGLRDAHLAAARPPRHAQARPQRRDPRGERAERAVRRRQGGRDAHQGTAGAGLQRDDEGPPVGSERVREHHPARERRRVAPAPEGCGARGARRARTTASSASTTGGPPR